MTAPVALYDRNGNQIGELRNISTATEPDIGKWHISDASPHRVNCDRCHKRLVPNVEWIKLYSIPTNFCPNCGRRMWPIE